MDFSLAVYVRPSLMLSPEALKYRSALLVCNGDGSSGLGIYDLSLGVCTTKAAGPESESIDGCESIDTDRIGITLDPGPFSL